ncbi:MAG TPA: FHA domain-containing protein [Chloroflexaceae bacterium]|nr:FHA domain-containing protein [Chloroflexaceae bacterium]
MAKPLTLIGISGSRVGQATVVEGRSSVIGSAGGCDLMMHDRLILPRHAELRVALDRWFIRPLDPRATVFVNGEPVTAQQRIEAGDLVTVGTATFKAAIGTSQERQVGGTARW